MTIILFILALLGLITLGFHLYTGVPPHPSSGEEIAAALELLSTQELQEGPIYELGSGWGGWITAIAKAYPDRKIIGIELSPVPFVVCWLRTRHLKNVQLEWGNFFEHNLSDAAAVCCYLMAGPMPELAKKLEKELPPNRPVLTIAFLMREWTPVEERKVGGVYPGQVLLYVTTGIH